LTLVNMQCGECGIQFAVPDFFNEERKKTGKGWFCPNGHSRVYRESDADKFRRERDQAIQQKAMAEQQAAEADERARKGGSERSTDEEARSGRRLSVLQSHLPAAREPHGEEAPDLQRRSGNRHRDPREAEVLTPR